MGLLDSIKGLLGGGADKASDAAGKAAASAGETAAKAKDVAGQAAATGAVIAAQAKGAVAGVADQHGDKVTGAVSAAHEFVSDKTGGKLDPVTGAAVDITERAVGAIKSDPGTTAPPEAEPEA